MNAPKRCAVYAHVSTVDTTTPIGKMTFAFVVAMDEFFLDILKENTKAGLAATRRRGRRLAVNAVFERGT
jgi:DNA invertase Pin-like site-specific DNA recombinase